MGSKQLHHINTRYYTHTREMPRAELYLSTILGERTSIGLDLRECLDIWIEDDLLHLVSPDLCLLFLRVARHP